MLFQRARDRIAAQPKVQFLLDTIQLQAARIAALEAELAALRVPVGDENVQRFIRERKINGDVIGAAMVERLAAQLAAVTAERDALKALLNDLIDDNLLANADEARKVGYENVKIALPLTWIDAARQAGPQPGDAT